jgi:hypothetical protein
VLEPLFRQFFGGFLNTKGFWFRVFIPISSFIFSFHFRKRVLWGERLGFLLRFSGEFSFQSLVFPISVLSFLFSTFWLRLARRSSYSS